MAFSSGGPEGFGLWVVDVTTGERRMVAPGGLLPAWSPDGTRIAYSEEQPANDELAVVDADGTGKVLLTAPDGSDLRRLTDDTLDDQFPAWSPDSSRILFQHHGTVHVMNADGTCPTAVTGPLAPGQFVSWRPR